MALPSAAHIGECGTSRIWEPQATYERQPGLGELTQPLMAHVRGLHPVLAVPESSITSTPPPCGAVAGSLSSSSSRRALTRSGSHRDSDKKNCSRCTAGCCAPVTGSAPASAVSVVTR